MAVVREMYAGERFAFKGFRGEVDKEFDEPIELAEPVEFATPYEGSLQRVLPQVAAYRRPRSLKFLQDRAAAAEVIRDRIHGQPAAGTMGAPAEERSDVPLLAGSAVWGLRKMSDSPHGTLASSGEFHFSGEESTTPTPSADVEGEACSPAHATAAVASARCASSAVTAPRAPASRARGKHFRRGVFFVGQQEQCSSAVAQACESEESMPMLPHAPEQLPSKKPPRRAIQGAVSHIQRSAA